MQNRRPRYPILLPLTDHDVCRSGIILVPCTDSTVEGEAADLEYFEQRQELEARRYRVLARGCPRMAPELDLDAVRRRLVSLDLNAKGLEKPGD